MPLLFLLLLLLMPLPTHAAVGDLMVSPTRVVFSGRDRTATVNLVNRGSEAATYRVSIIHQRMDVEGNYTEITEPIEGERFLEPYLRYSPRQITLEPGSAQTVRIMVRKPADLEEGEYRSHMLFRALPPADLGQNIEPTDTPENGLSVRLIPIFGVSIPLILEQGELSRTASISNLRWNPDQQELSMHLAREGNATVHGDIQIMHNNALLGQLRGVSILDPFMDLTITLPLSEAAKQLGSGDTLTITFSEKPEQGADLISSHRFTLP